MLVILCAPAFAHAMHWNAPNIMAAAHDVDTKAELLHETVHNLTGGSQLGDAAHALADAAEHLHEVVEMGADIDHIREDFQDVSNALDNLRRVYHTVSYDIMFRTRRMLRDLEHSFFTLRMAVYEDGGHFPPPPPPGPVVRQIACSSVNFTQQNCYVGSAGSALDVNLVAQYSNRPCIKNSNFGITGDQTAIWVSGGCRGLFNVTVRQ